MDGVYSIGSGQYHGWLVLWCWRRVINEICPDLCLYHFSSQAMQLLAKRVHYRTCIEGVKKITIGLCGSFDSEECCELQENLRKNENRRTNPPIFCGFDSIYHYPSQPGTIPSLEMIDGESVIIPCLDYEIAEK